MWQQVKNLSPAMARPSIWGCSGVGRGPELAGARSLARGPGKPLLGIALRGGVSGRVFPLDQFLQCHREWPALYILTLPAGAFPDLLLDLALAGVATQVLQ